MFQELKKMFSNKIPSVFTVPEYNSWKMIRSGISISRDTTADHKAVLIEKLTIFAKQTKIKNGLSLFYFV